MPLTKSKSTKTAKKSASAAVKTPAKARSAQPSRRAANPAAPARPSASARKSPTTRGSARKSASIPPAAKPAPATSELPADIVDRQLEKYRSMRNFGVTAEPSGDDQTGARTTASGTLPFCIQKHAASHLHYDFRLGWNGVLKSWAVAKGPSYVTADKRLAVQVEDHPIEYGGFEGIIPKGQYGGGTVMLWEEGTWAPQPGYEDVDKGLRDGSLKFLLFGAKLQGKWALIRMGGRFADAKKPNWLLIKEHDAYERSAADPSITEAEPNSAATGRTMEQIAANEDHVWNSKDTAKEQGRAWFRADARQPPSAGPAANAASGAPAALSAGVKAALSESPEEPQPEFLKPQLATEALQPPEGSGWLHELKLDGYRMQARKSARGVEMLTRSGLDWTYRVPSVAEAVARLPVSSVTLDGEVVVLREDGTTNFADLQASFQEGAKHPLSFFCFDLLHLEGRNTRGLPLSERKLALSEILARHPEETLRFSEHIESGGAELFHQACELHAEGIISKLAAAPYRAGRNNDWLKAKCLHEQEFVIGGFTLPSNGIHGVGALLLGYNSGGKLVYAGRTGTGFTHTTHRNLRDRLDALRAPARPFASLPAGAGKGAVWVRPALVAQVRFATWTAEDLVRQAAFLGLREDKPAREVTREQPRTAPRPKQQKGASAPGDSSRNGDRPRTALPAIRLTHPGKVLDQQSGVTKQKLAEYFWAVSEHMLPHIADRPLTLVRCPEGSEKPCFYQKHVNHLLPAGVTAVDVPEKRTGIPEPYITLRTPEALTGLAQMGVLELHPWGSCNSNLEHPDRLILDLDPDENLPWSVVTQAALGLRDRLRSIGLESFVKTTGGKGLHVVAPITPALDWNKSKEVSRTFVVEMEREQPGLYLTKMTKAARKGKIYLDFLRNDRGATAVAPYSPRARAGLPVSMPLDWTELRSGDRPVFTVATLDQWRDRLHRDPWEKLPRLRQKLDL